MTTLVFNPFTGTLDFVGSPSVSSSFSVMIPPESVAGDGSVKIYTFSKPPSVIVVDGGRSMVRVSKDGTVNWTGTSVVTLTVGPTADIFGF